VAPRFAPGDVILVEVNFDSKRVIFKKNGSVADSMSLGDLSAPLYPVVSLRNQGTCFAINFDVKK
jgi:hypothetical protein